MRLIDLSGSSGRIRTYIVLRRALTVRCITSLPRWNIRLWYQVSNLELRIRERLPPLCFHLHHTTILADEVGFEPTTVHRLASRLIVRRLSTCPRQYLVSAVGIEPTFSWFKRPEQRPTFATHPIYFLFFFFLR